MRNVEGGSNRREHSCSVSSAAGVYCSIQRSRARTQYKPQSRSRVLRIHAARTWVNCSCVSPRSALHAIFAPAEPKRARSAGPIGARGSVSPTSLARQVGVRRGRVNLIRRSHELDLHHLHQHAAEEEGFGGSCSVRVDPTTAGANGWWGRRRRKNGRRTLINSTVAGWRYEKAAKTGHSIDA